MPRPLIAVLAVLTVHGCSSRNVAVNPDDGGGAAEQPPPATDQQSASPADVGAPNPDAAPATPPSSCPLPLYIDCDMPQPDCPEGHYPAAEPCGYGACEQRCWTGDCLPCGTECQADADCALVGFHGCCGMAGDCARGCFWAKPKAVLAEACYFAAGCPVPDPPPGCASDCIDDPRCEACPHCGPDLARCEGGHCISAWSCEPRCGGCD